VFVAFDLLEKDSVDLRTQPYRRRLDTLYCLPRIGPEQPIQFIHTASMTPGKRSMLAELRRQNKEGVVFKRINAPYTPGRPAGGGDQLKLKFTATASCIVAGTNGSKRSVKLELLGLSGSRVRVGSVTVPPNQPIPTTGSIVEIRFLYAYPDGALFQPVLLGVRDDVDLGVCTVRQLKYKATDDEDGEAEGGGV
jgi:bifunctional non-homologous end joining protein LigD